MTRKVRIVDVFTDKPLFGNQLAVVLDAKGMPIKLMQRIAREMNFSETTFVLPPKDPDLHSSQGSAVRGPSHDRDRVGARD